MTGSVLLVTKGLDIGGIERIVVDLALGLKRRGVDVEVAVVNDRRDHLAELLDGAGVPLHRLGGTDHIGWGAARRLTRLVSSPRYAVIHVHGPLPSIVARLAPRGRPIVTTSHTVWTALRPLTRVMWRVTARRDAATTAVSAVVAQSLPRSIANRVVVLPHGVDRERVEQTLAARTADPQREGVTAIAVASHRDVKNYPNLLRAIAIARSSGVDLRLIAIGDGPDLDRHRSIAAELGLAEVVTFLPPVLDPLPAIAAADLLIVASDFEGQPLVVVEALALGCPVVATAVGRVPELVSPAVGLVVPPGNPEALGAALVEVASNDDLRRALSISARAQVSAWTLDEVIDAHVALYREAGRMRGGNSS